ncbi:MAG: 2-octaprenyl-6-methoxyphenyl hydroxylase [Gammaproteobacteria bacterium]|nr:2-octaprenyl-6-methoxyphenyl hydroxylase [Gammaproteobacteria bacterium]
MTRDYDVLIVGGGLAGAAMACALSASAYRIALIEAQAAGDKHPPGYDDRSLALAFGSRRILEGLGLWQAIAPAATPIKTVHVSERGRFGAARLHQREEGVAALGYVVPSHDLAQAVYARLSAQDNVDIVAPARVRNFIVDGSLVDARVDGDAEKGEAQGWTLRGRLLIAADGASSGMRRQLGIAAATADYGQTAIIANVTPSRDHQCAAYERFTDAGPLALLPMSEQRCALVWTHPATDAAAILRLSDAQFLAKLQESFGYRLGRFTKVGTRQAYPLTINVARDLVAPRAVLIGNAAHTLHPVAGQGFNLALRDVAELADLLRTHAPRDPAEQSLLGRYAARRKADLRAAVRFTDTLARAFVNPFPPLVCARGAALLALDAIPPLRHMLARRAMGLSGKPPRLTSGLSLVDLTTGELQ